MHAADQALADFERGDAVTLKATSQNALPETPASMKTANKRLAKMAVAFKLHPNATGSLVVTTGLGADRTIESDSYAKGVWHALQILAVLSTSTVTDAHVELGYLR